MDDRIPTPGQEGRVFITPENGDPAFFATVEMADNPTDPGTPLNKSTLLQDATCKILDIPNTSVPNDAFLKLALGIGQYGYLITVLYPDGTPIQGAVISGVNTPAGKTLITDENGLAVGVSSDQSITITVTSPYIDIQSMSGVSIQSTGILTAYTITLPYNIGVNTLRTSQTLSISPKTKTADFCVVGGGGGGAWGSGQYARGGGGGGGGYVSNLLGAQITSEDTISILIGAGGAATGDNGEEGEFTAPGGGTTTISKNLSVILSASGGNGGTGYYRDGDASGGIGNGNGGGSNEVGTDGTGYIFNDASLGLAGGGGGGGDDSEGLSTGLYSGLPYGAKGSNFQDNINASTAGIGGGGGGGATTNFGGGGQGSSGGDGAVYIRFNFI